MGLETLILSRDPETLRVVRSALNKLDIAVEVCTGAEAASEILETKKLDAIIVDCDDVHGGLDVLKQVRKGASNKTTVTFAVLNGATSMRTVFDMGASFVLQKPITPLSALRSFHAAYGVMHRERRRYFRMPVEIPVTLYYRQSDELKVIACNLSEGGMAIRSTAPLPKGGVSRVEFSLPDTNISLSAKAHIAWNDPSGHAGVRFTELAPSSREQLEKWLLEKIEDREPIPEALKVR